MVVVRYATLAKLIRDSREDVIANKIHFKSIDDYKFHIFKYEKRLSLLKKALSSSLFSGILIIVSVVGVTFNYYFFYFRFISYCRINVFINLGINSVF
jgi:hypothetical protein